MCFLTESINIGFTGCVLCTSSHSLYVGRSEHFIESVMHMDTVMFQPGASSTNKKNSSRAVELL